MVEFSILNHDTQRVCDKIYLKRKMQVIVLNNRVIILYAFDCIIPTGENYYSNATTFMKNTQENRNF